MHYSSGIWSVRMPILFFCVYIKTLTEVTFFDLLNSNQNQNKADNSVPISLAIPMMLVGSDRTLFMNDCNLA